LGLRDVHHLVEAKERRRPALFLQEVSDARGAPADAMLGLIARRSNTGLVFGAIPDLGGVGEDMPEPVQRMFNAGVGFECAGFDVGDPRVSGPDVGEDQFVVDRLLVYQKVRKLVAR